MPTISPDGQGDGSRGFGGGDDENDDTEDSGWNWSFQGGGPGGDRGMAFANGAGEHIHKRYLVGTEDGVAVLDTAAFTGEKSKIRDMGPFNVFRKKSGLGLASVL